MAVNEAEETFKKLMTIPGVQGIIVMNADGIPIRTTLPHNKATLLVSLVHGFLLKTKAVIKEMDHTNELSFIRLRSQKDEILIAPDKEFTMVVVQKPSPI